MKHDLLNIGDIKDEDKLLGGGDTRGKKTLFHGGFNYLERIDALLKQLDDVKIPDTESEQSILGIGINQYQSRWALLKCLFSELYPKMDELERRSHLLVYKLGEQYFNKTMNDINTHRRMINCDFMELFDSWELELRDMVEKKGLLMPSAKDGLDAADS